MPATSPSSDDATLLEQALFEVRKVIVGQDRLVERLLVALLARGHVLLEGPPGVAKTLAAETMATVVGGSFARVQFTPDLLPADITGTRIYRASTERFDVELGPIFVNFVLADEINRAPAKVQSALLEVMAERQVSIGGRTYPVPEPFLVVATQNPAESEGVYPLPEAQRDRFLMKITVDHPSPSDELEIVRRMGTEPPTPVERLALADLTRVQTAARSAVYVDHGVQQYAVDLVSATRDPARYGLAKRSPYIACGASSRATLGLIGAGCSPPSRRPG
jgi:MoxR-like ATPase